MRRIAFSVLGTLIVVAIFGGLNGFLSATYFIPPYYSGRVFLTYLPLMVGVLCSAPIGGYIGYRVRANGSVPLKVSLGICYACVTTVLVFNLFMLILVNMRGE
jgi:hypothetical protein